MLRIINDLYERYFSEEEALIFTILIIVGIMVMMTLGGGCSSAMELGN